MTPLPRPCLDCGTPIHEPTRCTPCRLAHQRQREHNRAKRDRSKYSGNYKARAKAVRDNATTCWVCGGGNEPQNPFQADHLNPDDPASPLLPAHRKCNIQRAHAIRAEKKQQALEATSNHGRG